MNRFRTMTAAGIALAALSIAAPSYADGPGTRGHAAARGHGARTSSPVRIAPMRQPRLIAPRFGMGYGSSHLSAHGLGYGYGYDPFGWPAYGFGVGAQGYYASPTANLGGVRIKEAPRDAAVYVDDAYAGVVDNFDGRLQRLTLEPGAYRIDVRGAGVSESLNVNVQPGRTTTVRVQRP